MAVGGSQSCEERKVPPPKRNGGLPLPLPGWVRGEGGGCLPADTRPEGEVGGPAGGAAAWRCCQRPGTEWVGGWERGGHPPTGQRWWDPAPQVCFWPSEQPRPHAPLPAPVVASAAPKGSLVAAWWALRSAQKVAARTAAAVPSMDAVRMHAHISQDQRVLDINCSVWRSG